MAIALGCRVSTTCNIISHGAKAKSTVSKPNIHEGVRSNRLGLLIGFDSSTHPPNENEVGVETTRRDKHATYEINKTWYATAAKLSMTIFIQRTNAWLASRHFMV